MATWKIQESTLTDIADAVREKKGTTEPIEVTNLANEIKGISGGGISNDVKTALLNCFAHVAWADANGQTYYNALQTALNGGSPVTPELSSISAVLSGSYTVGDSISTVTGNITVTATYSDSSTDDVTADAVFDTTNVNMNTAGTYTIGVSYTEDGVTKTTSVSLTVNAIELSSISAVLSGSYTTDDTISDVTSNIAVTATYSNSTTANVTSSAVFDTTNVNMSTAGTYTIGVSYTEGGVTKTTSVSLTVASATRELSSISATLSGTYDTSDTISDVTSNITVTAMYDDTTTANVTSSAVLDTSNVDMTTAGTYSIGVSYTEGGITKTTTVSLTVNASGSSLDNWSITAYKYVNKNTGLIENSESYKGISDFLPIKANTTYSVAFAQGFTDNAVRPYISIFEYPSDSDSSMITKHYPIINGTDNASATFTTDANTQYILISLNAQNMDSLVPLTNNTTVLITEQ